MSNDFDLNKSRWYLTMKVGLHSRHIKNNAGIVAECATALASHSYDAPTGTALAEAETALSEALLAVQVARASYERVTLQAAE